MTPDYEELMDHRDQEETVAVPEKREKKVRCNTGNCENQKIKRVVNILTLTLTLIIVYFDNSTTNQTIMFKI